MSNFSVRWRLCRRRDFLVTPTVAPNYGWVHGKSIMSRCYCPPLFRRTIHRIHTILRRYPVFPGRPICSCPGPTFPLIPPLYLPRLYLRLLRADRAITRSWNDQTTRVCFTGVCSLGWKLRFVHRASPSPSARQRKPLSFGKRSLATNFKTLSSLSLFFFAASGKTRFVCKDLPCTVKREILSIKYRRARLQILFH